MAAAIAVSMGQDDSADVKEDVNLAEEAVSCSNSDKSEVKEVIDTSAAQAIVDAEATKQAESDKKLLFTLKAERVWVCGEIEGEDD
jgi:hypothetical protein